MNEHLGIDLDGLLPQIASLEEISCRRQERTVGDLPPSIALGSLSGEAPRLDVQLPIDARGSGLDSSEDPAMAFGVRGIARLPVTYAWEMLAHVREGHRSPTWCWGQEGGATGAITPGHALAVATRDLEASLLKRESMSAMSIRGSRTLVVPNTLSEPQQDQLLRSLRLELGQTRLLWRPVAATLAWIDRHAGGLGEVAAHLESIGDLLHLHLSTESWEATVLEVVCFVDETGTRWLLPGRRLPEDGPAAPLRGWASRCLEHVAARVLQRDRSVSDARRWNLLWGTAWSHASVLDEASSVRAVLALPPWSPPRLAADARMQLARMLSDISLGDGPDDGWLAVESRVGDRSNLIVARDWLRNLKNAIRPSRLLGAVVSGPFAALPVSAGVTLGKSLVAGVATVAPNRILVEGANSLSRGLLAGGAAEFSRRSALGQPTYLDTLPSVRMIAMVDTEPEWINLLETDEAWVMGSQTWSKEIEKTRFSIQKGERELIVSVHRGGAPTCRRVRADFDAPAETFSPVRLLVSITPGQGAPRVEVRPTDRSVLQGRNLTFDWTTAEDTGRTAREEIDSVERVCPRHEPRIASHGKWAERNFHLVRGVCGIKGLVRMFVDGRSTVRTVDGSAKHLLPWIHVLLKEWDRTRNLGWATAVSSDFTLELSSPEDERLLERFVALVDAQVSSEAESGSEALRIMAAMSATGPNLNLLLGRFLDGQMGGDQARSWWAAGHCLRSSDHIRRMIEFASVRGGTTSFKQVARALMFRKDALASTPPELAGKLLRLAVRQARELTTQGRFQIAFQEAALLCAYLLRERIYYPEFATFGSPEYALLESTFESAKLKMERGASVMGGVINKMQLVEDVLLYARSRGRGRLVAYAQD